MKTFLVAAAGVSFLAAPAFAVTQTIDFEAFSNGDIIGTVGNATFSAAGGAEIYDFGGDFAESGVNTVGPSGGDFNGDLFVDFAMAVSDLSFFSGGDNDSGTVASINVFVSGLFDSTIGLLGDGNLGTTEFQDLSAFSNVTRIEIVNVTDAFGLVYDDFTFTYDDTPAGVVPLPAAGWFLLGGIAGLGALSLRKRKKS